MIKSNVKHLLDNNHLVIGIGELAEMSGVTTRQLRYWESKGFIESQQNEQHTARHFTLVNIIKVELIKEFIDEGYTLKKAVEKAETKRLLISNVKQLINHSFVEAIAEEDHYTVISLGNFEGTDDVIYLIRNNHTEQNYYRLQNKEQPFELKKFINFQKN